MNGQQIQRHIVEQILLLDNGLVTAQMRLHSKRPMFLLDLNELLQFFIDDPQRRFECRGTLMHLFDQILRTLLVLLTQMDQMFLDKLKAGEMLGGLCLPVDMFLGSTMRRREKCRE